jgi:hypothetical protein
MKKLMFSLFLFASMLAGAQTMTLPKNNDGGLYLNNGKGRIIPPGTTVMLEGDYAYINLDSVIGTPEKPITFKLKAAARAGTNGGYGFIITHSKYFIIDGALPTGEPYGFKIGGPVKGKYIPQTFGFATSDNFEIKNCELLNGQVGFFGAPLGGGIYQNIFIHNNYVHNLDNPDESGRSEGVYLGNTSVRTRLTGAGFKNVEISYNVFDSLAGDGIQIALTELANVHHNKILKYGGANLEQQRSAIVIGGCTNGIFEFNEISNGTGAGFQVFGAGEIFIRNNTLTNVASTATEDAFYIHSICSDITTMRLHLINNIVKGTKPARDIVRDDLSAIVENVGNSWNPAPPPPPPVRTVFHKGYFTLNGKRFYYTLYSDGTWQNLK